MRILSMLAIIALMISLAVPVCATQFAAPQVPEAGAEQMPENTDSFGAGLWELCKNVLASLHPDLREGIRVSLSLIAAVMMVSLLRTCSGGVSAMAELAGTVAVAAILLFSANSMLALGSETVRDMSEYGKLLFPVLTAAMAAQGGVTASAALYTGTIAVDVVVSSLITGLLLPMVYLFLALATANSALEEDVLKKMRDLIKSAVSWCLKTILTVFMTYMGITGVISGTTDAAALKATKFTISNLVPVVGGILSDASEAVLVSAGLARNAAGIYGILAILAIFLGPFCRIWIQYMILKVTAAVCGIFGSKRMMGLIEDFSTAMGLVLAMTGAVCLLLLISTVCFLKGVG